MSPLSSVATRSVIIPATHSGHPPKPAGMVPDSVADYVPDWVAAFIPDSVAGISRNTHFPQNAQIDVLSVNLGTWTQT